MTSLSFADRLSGCLVGAVVGAELGFTRYYDAGRFNVAPERIFDIPLEPIVEVRETRGRVDIRKATPFINLGVQAYVTRGGRATPEDFAALLKDDAAIAGPVFHWDGVHTTQEVLKEGMHPRISGLGVAPSGLIAAAMPAVGIYHYADPEYAYLDGVELASVAQPRLGADWAGLCAAGVAAAFDSMASPEDVIETTLKLAHQNNKEVFYQMNNLVRSLEWWNGMSEADFAHGWVTYEGRGQIRNPESWGATNPISFVLPLLWRYAARPEAFMALVLAPRATSWTQDWSNGRSISAIIGGAIIGALHGTAIFPAAWRAWAEPQIQPWLPLAGIVAQRREKERRIVQITEELVAPRDTSLSRLHDKVYGCILAGAIGNAMGSPVEGKMFWEIDGDHPEGITTVLEPRRLESEDDNQMAMTLVETYLERDGKPVMARHFGKRWKDYLNRDHFFPQCMGNAYDLICQGWDARITGHWIQVTGSTVMCMEPVGVYHLADPEFAALDATAVSYMYQRGLDVVAAGMLAATVAEAFNPQATVESVLQAALEVAPRTKLHTFDERPFHSAYDYISTCLDIADKYDDVLAVRAELYEKCLCYHMIDPLELWGFALAMLKVSRGDVRQAAIGGTNIGRDSDTIAGRAAMLAGTLAGAAGIPAEWIALFKPDVLARIKGNAGLYADLIATKKLPRMQRRQRAITA